MGRIKKALCNLSIKKTFMLYMLVFLLLATFLSSMAINISNRIKTDISLSYSNTNKEVVYDEQTIIIVPGQNDVRYTAKDKVIINLYDFIQTWSIPIFFGVCIIMSSLLFYRNKLNKPIEILSNASERIKENDLNFNILYDSKDEMGQLCSSFEKMRASLEENNYEMWRTMEERKRLNAAFSHDLRTPLTVLRGYTDFLRNYLPQEKVTREKLISTVGTMSEHISRLENYVTMMSAVQKLEDICVTTQKTDVGDFTEQLKGIAAILSGEHRIDMKFTNNITVVEINVDTKLIIQVFENIISNAVRYAKSRIDISCGETSGMLTITVSDDGRGFSAEDLQNAAKPFYKDKTNTGEQHFGLGLNISKILCEKHGGVLLLKNTDNGGACVVASFSSGKK